MARMINTLENVKVIDKDELIIMEKSGMKLRSWRHDEPLTNPDKTYYVVHMSSRIKGPVLHRTLRSTS